MTKEKILETFKKHATGSVQFKDVKLKNVIDSSKGKYFSEQYLLGYDDCTKDLIELLRQVLFEPWYLKKNE